jgi:DNA-binding NtrC family response regulator
MNRPTPTSTMNATHATHANRATILLVDDDVRVTDALVRALRREAWQFVCASSGAEALAVLESVPVDVIVSDERMPGLCGSEFLAMARARWPTTVRIILSGEASLDAAVRAINESEVFRFLLKPAHPVDLRMTIRQALQQKRMTELSRRLLRDHRRQSRLLATVAAGGGELTAIDFDASGAVVPDGEDASLDDLLQQMELAVAARDERSALREPA